MQIPEWSECEDKEAYGEELTPIERFVLDNEPAGADGEEWRRQLQAAVDSLVPAGNGKKF